MRTSALVTVALLLGGGLVPPSAAVAQPQITTTTIGPGLFLVHTQVPQPLPGGVTFGMNNLLLVNPHAVVLVDTMFPAPFAPLFLNTIHGLAGARPVGAIIDTHWHFDHVGMNKAFRQADGASVLAHWRAGALMQAYPCTFDVPGGTCWTPFTDPMDQPTDEIEGTKRLKAGNEIILVRAFEKAHSGADVIVFLTRANVVAAGDVYFGGMYPIIDRAGGGTLNGVIAAVKYLLAKIDDETLVVPSHGAAGNRQSVADYLKMLETTRKKVLVLMAAGLTEDEVMAHPAFGALDARWGVGFITGPIFRRIVYRDLAGTNQ